MEVRRKSRPHRRQYGRSPLRDVLAASASSFPELPPRQSRAPLIAKMRHPYPRLGPGNKAPSIPIGRSELSGVSLRNRDGPLPIWPALSLALPTVAESTNASFRAPSPDRPTDAGSRHESIRSYHRLWSGNKATLTPNGRPVTPGR